MIPGATRRTKTTTAIAVAGTTNPSTVLRVPDDLGRGACRRCRRHAHRHRRWPLADRGFRGRTSMSAPLRRPPLAVRVSFVPVGVLAVEVGALVSSVIRAVYAGNRRSSGW